MENDLEATDDEADDRLDVAALVRMFEESEDATSAARQDAQRDRDYVDNKQLTAAEIAALNKRGQPPQIDNRIKTKIDYLVGLEKQQRIDPRAAPRTPMHEDDAKGATEALRYVADTEKFDTKRSGVWRNLLVEGAGGMSVSVEHGYDGFEVRLRRTPWDRMFWDPHSSEPDFSDAAYLGIVIWKDYDEAIREYPAGREALETTLQSAPSDTYDDKPKFNHWADKKRKRVRICQIWLKRGDAWHFAEFTKGGILKSGLSPYKTDKGESDCELFFQSAYVDRDNNRYGLVREMITLQDGVNKRLSKTLHLLNTSQTVYEEGAVDDIEVFRRESVKPDGTMQVAPNALAEKRIQFNTRTDLADGHFKLLLEAKNSIDLKGPNATQMGDKAQGSASASGRAIIASQQGGMISLGDLLDHLRDLDDRVFRAIWARIRQFWTGQKWVRVTDEQRNVKWVGINVDPQQIQMAAQQNPELARMISSAVANVAELDCDIIIDESPDSTVPALEQFEALVQLKQYDANNELPFRALVMAAPNLKDKAKVLEEMDKRQQPNPMAQQAQKIQMDGAVAQVEETKSKAALNMAKAQEAMMPEPGQPAQQQDFEVPPQLQIAQVVSNIQLTDAKTDHTMMQTRLAPAKAQSDARMKHAALQQRNRQPQSAA